MLKLNICEDNTLKLDKYLYNLNLLSINLKKRMNNLYIKNKTQMYNYNILIFILYKL